MEWWRRWRYGGAVLVGGTPRGVVRLFVRRLRWRPRIVVAVAFAALYRVIRKQTLIEWWQHHVLKIPYLCRIAIETAAAPTYGSVARVLGRVIII
jgi:hypothetical protein